MVYVEVAIIVALILLNGFLAMSELAVVSSRISRLKTLQEQGAYGSRRALALASDPGRFLSSVQIGITLVGVASGAFSGATLGLRVSAWLEMQGVANDIAEALGVGIVVAIIAYASLIVGELVP
jgi:putative hemolysin